ncbi:SMC-Scp complex subunit ScpB [Dokdonella sp. MW10]|uniref:SMC-Scp complex subunit ScpB n=1 Tax=Dokdonella sp. MW10 TaxID=2992926 RepID=UPI003F7EF5C2
MIEPDSLKRIIEAALLAASNPLSPTQLLALFGDEEMPSHDDIAHALADLQADCETRGIELVEVASGFRYQVRAEVHGWVARLWTERPSRYSRALLETLALIAYRQPITRGEIEQIRGVAVSTNIVKTLEEREWVRVVGYRDMPGKPALLGTTRGFLDYFNLKSLDELPALSDIRDIEEFDPQLALDGAPIARIAAPSADTADDEATGEGELPEADVQALADAAASLGDVQDGAADGADAETDAVAGTVDATDATIDQPVDDEPGDAPADDDVGTDATTHDNTAATPDTDVDADGHDSETPDSGDDADTSTPKTSPKRDGGTTEHDA